MIIFLTIVTLSTAQGQQQDTIKPDNPQQHFQLRPFRFHLAPFYLKLKSEYNELNWQTKSPGIRFAITAHHPEFLFCYADIIYEFYEEQDFRFNGNPIINKEEYLLIETGIGTRGRVPLLWGLGLEGESSVNLLKTPFLPDIYMGISWENKKNSVSLKIGNLIKLREASAVNPHLLFGINFGKS